MGLEAAPQSHCLVKVEVSQKGFTGKSLCFKHVARSRASCLSSRGLHYSGDGWERSGHQQDPVGHQTL